MLPAGMAGQTTTLRDEPMRGIPLMLGSLALFSVSDALAKYLGQGLAAVEVAWLRYLAFVALAAIPFLRRGGLARLRPRAPRLQVLRGLAIVGSGVLFITGLQHLPLAEATAINFVSPAIVTLLSVLVLGEQVGWRRWTAIGVGILGMLIIVRPGTDAFTWAAIFPLLSCSCWAAALIITRRMGAADPPETTLFWTAVTGFAALNLVLPFSFQWPSPAQVGLGLLMGLVATTAQFLVVLAYRATPASVLAPFTYCQLITSGLLGAVFFGGVPDLWTLVGAAVIAASGIYTAHRERVRARRR